MRRVGFVLVAVVALFGCGGSDDGVVATTSAPARSTTTIDADAAIRQYASAVATLRAELDGNVLPCSPLFDCAVGVAVGWDEFHERVRELTEDVGRPDEISRLIDDAVNVDAEYRSATGALHECSRRVADDNPTITCSVESIRLLALGRETLVDLEAWSPYL